MGSLTSRQNAGVEEVDVTSNHAYKYPPKSGNYFASHFIMGGERFDTPQPEAYLFGENVDLNFLGSKPTPFPYPPPQANEPTKTLRSLVNIRKESVRFVRPPDSVLRENFSEDAPKENKFNIEFTFDCDSKCAITLYYFCTEEVTSSGLVYTPKDPSMTSQTYHYKRGSGQQFSQPSHIFNPSKFYDEELSYDLEKEIIPIAIHCVVEDEGDHHQSQSHTTYAVVDRHSDGTYVLRALKQKLYVDGLCYLLQEIYGIENKNSDSIKAVSDEETEDNGSECVVCMCDVRDTLILPCKHFCLCNSCADSLRYQANNCPICRAPFRALLQIRALQKSSSVSNSGVHEEGSCEHIPPGYEAVSLIEALNGPCTLRSTACHDLAETPNSESAAQAAEMLNRSNNSEEGKKSVSENGSLHRTTGTTGSTPEFRMSVLLSREDGSKSSPSLCRRSSSKRKDSHLDDDYCNEEKVATEPDQCFDGDSDAEKLSPLLVSKKIEQQNDQTHLEKESYAVGTGKKTAQGSGGDRGEDSDYYTPEDPAPLVLNPLYESDKDQPVPSSVESTPGRWVPVRDVTMAVSLPGTPISTSSHLSARSSGDSYSSTSSTRHLLAHNLVSKQEKIPSGQTSA